MNFDKHCAALLNACGYTEERFEEHWEDVGGPESGPRLSGHPAGAAWTLDNHEIIVTGGEVAHHGYFPNPPADWF